MPDTLFIDGLMQGALHQVAGDAAGMTGSAPVTAWLTSQLAGQPYSLAAIRALLPQLPRLFGHQYRVIEYTDTGPAPAPVIDRLVPESIDAGGADVTLHVFGEHFVPRSVILFNGGEETTVFVSTQELTTVIAGATATTPGTSPVQVTTPGPGGGESAGRAFYVLGSEQITVVTHEGDISWEVPVA